MKKKNIGLHHHVRLPDGGVLTWAAANDFVKILSLIRFMKLESIGIKCKGKYNNTVYDAHIYSGKTFHALRMPAQLKPDGTGKLLCVYRTDDISLEQDIPLEVHFVHKLTKAFVLLQN